MSESSFSKSRKFRSTLYPFAFPVVALCLGYLTFQVVNRLSIETATAKLRAIVETGATALSVWAENHQNAVGLLATDEKLIESVTALSQLFSTETRRANEPDFLTEKSRYERQINDVFRRASDRFGYRGFGILATDGEILLSWGMSREAMSAFQQEIQNGGRSQDILIRPVDSDFEENRAGSGEVEESGTSSEAGGLLAYFTAEILSKSGKLIAYLHVELPSSNGLDAILDSARVGDTGETFLVRSDGMRLNHAHENEDLNSLPKTRAFTQQLFDTPSEINASIAENSVDQRVRVEFLGLSKTSTGDRVGAGTRLDRVDAAIVTLVERGEVFAATLALKRILLAILGLSLLATVMNWVYLYRLSSLRMRVSDATAKIRRLGQYNLEEKVGEGGMGVVYKASHSLLQRPTAVKLILPDRASDRTIENFEREVMLTSRLTHPNTIAIYDYGRNEEGVFYYAMEYLDGVNLATLVNTEGPQPWPRVIHILRQVCDSLGEAHASGLIHRDIKPENVMLCKRGNRHDVVKVLDFGLAGDFSRTDNVEATRVQGTPAYMAPEAIVHPEQMDARVDVYAVGAVGYFLLCGRHVFSGDSANAILSQQLNSRPIPLTQRRPEVPQALQSLIMACLEKNPANRPYPIEQLGDRLLSLSSEIWTEEDARNGWLEIETWNSARSDCRRRGATSDEQQAISKTIDFPLD